MITVNVNTIIGSAEVLSFTLLLSFSLVLEYFNIFCASTNGSLSKLRHTHPKKKKKMLNSLHKEKIKDKGLWYSFKWFTYLLFLS